MGSKDVGYDSLGNRRRGPVGGGGGSVESVTGAAPGIVDDTDPANPVILGQFGANTRVPLPNAASTLVTALRLIASLTDDTPGAETSKWLLSLLETGVERDALSLEQNRIGVGDRIYFLNDGSQNTYIERRGEDNIGVVCAGLLVFSVDTTGIHLTAGIGAQLGWGTAGVDVTSATSRIKLHAIGPNQGNVQLGEDAAMATDDTAGFVTIPQMPGPPTVDPINVPAGQVPMVISNPGDTPSKLYFFLNGVWVSVALA